MRRGAWIVGLGALLSVVACVEPSNDQVTIGPEPQLETSARFVAVTATAQHELDVIAIGDNDRGTSIELAIPPAMCGSTAFVVAELSVPKVFELGVVGCDGFGTTTQASSALNSASYCYCDIYGTRRCQSCYYGSCVWYKSNCCGGFTSCPN